MSIFSIILHPRFGERPRSRDSTDDERAATRGRRSANQRRAAFSFAVALPPSSATTPPSHEQLAPEGATCQHRFRPALTHNRHALGYHG